MAAPSRPRNGDNPGGMPRRMRKLPRGFFEQHHDVKRGPNGEVCTP